MSNNLEKLSSIETKLEKIFSWFYTISGELTYIKKKLHKIEKKLYNR